MTELETMQRAKMYVEKMANGIDPLSDRPVQETDLINNVRISRCLFYVADILQKVIDKQERKGRNRKKEPFRLNEGEIARFMFSAEPIPISEITKRINVLIDRQSMRCLKNGSISGWLVQAGYLVEQLTDEGKRKRATDMGRAIGILTEERIGYKGPYEVILYTEPAQRFLIDNLDAIIEYEKNEIN